MADLKITLKGMADAQKQMQRIEEGARQMGAHEGLVFSRSPYAYGAEFGEHRVSGKMARWDGGTYYLTRAVDEVEHGGVGDLTEGLTKVTAPGPWILRRLSRWVRRKARLNAPKGELRQRKRKDGKRRKRLRQTIRAEVRKRGS